MVNYSGATDDEHLQRNQHIIRKFSNTSTCDDNKHFQTQLLQIRNILKPLTSRDNRHLQKQTIHDSKHLESLKLVVIRHFQNHIFLVKTDIFKQKQTSLSWTLYTTKWLTGRAAWAFQPDVQLCLMDLNQRMQILCSHGQRKCVCGAVYPCIVLEKNR